MARPTELSANEGNLPPVRRPARPHVILWTRRQTPCFRSADQLQPDIEVRPCFVRRRLAVPRERDLRSVGRERGSGLDAARGRQRHDARRRHRGFAWTPEQEPASRQDDGQQGREGSPSPPAGGFWRRRERGPILRDVLQLHFHVRHVLQAAFGILAKAAQDEPLEITWDLRHEVARRLWLVAKDLRQRFRCGGPVKCTSARDHLVQHRAEREDVGARVHAPARDLLGCHVAGGAADAARDEHTGRRVLEGRVRGARAFRRFGQLCQAEVEHLHRAVRGHHDVGGLEVAVDDARRVRTRERIGDGDADADGLVDAHPGSHQRAHGLAVDELHDDEVDAVRRRDVMNGRDVGMIERGGAARFLEEAAAAALVGPAIGPEDLEGDVAPQPRVSGSVDFRPCLRPLRTTGFRRAPASTLVVHAWLRGSTPSLLRRPRTADRGATGTRLRTTGLEKDLCKPCGPESVVSGAGRAQRPARQPFSPRCDAAGPRRAGWQLGGLRESAARFENPRISAILRTLVNSRNRCPISPW